MEARRRGNMEIWRRAGVDAHVQVCRHGGMEVREVWNRGVWACGHGGVYQSATRALGSMLSNLKFRRASW